MDNQFESKNVDALWREYAQVKSIDVKNELITHYLFVAKKVVKSLMPTCGQYIEYDDMLGYAVLGLIDAIDKFEIEKNVLFETYSSLRIRGEIIDNIRRLDWAPVSLRAKLKKMNNIYDEYTASGKSDVPDDVVAEKLGMSVDQMYKLQTSANMFHMVSFEDLIGSITAGNLNYVDVTKDDNAPDPSAHIEISELHSTLARLIGQLPEKEQLIIQLHYYEDIMIKDIAKILKISESRASQIHSKALGSLNSKLKQTYYESND